MAKGNYSVVADWVKRERRIFRDLMEDGEDEKRLGNYVTFCYAARSMMSLVSSDWLIKRLEEWDISEKDVNAEVVYRLENELKRALGSGLDSNIANQIEEILDNIDEEDE
ncbi:MAG: hypothetical protein OXI77_18085 [Chloroflexota bacterium]|nr:hypothetical protein [Chloroflexota bacterium]MDE2908296.1 hypothetical protein [Chloroflexota bacterium]